MMFDTHKKVIHQRCQNPTFPHFLFDLGSNIGLIGITHCRMKTCILGGDKYTTPCPPSIGHHRVISTP